MKKIITLLFFLLLGFSEREVIASNTKDIQGSYSVSAIPSEHQTEGVESFFDIGWKPSSKEEFGILITNNSDKYQTYNIHVNKARTNKNGIIDYSDTIAEEGMKKYKLTKMIQLQSEVTVGPRESHEVEGSLTFPKESFNGILMAGIHVSEKETKESKSTVSNTVSYNLPFVVRGDINVRPKANINLEKVSMEKFSSTQSSLDVQLLNEEATFLKESNFQVEITDKNDKTVLKQSSKIDITPQTKFIYPVKLPEEMNEGKYKLLLKVQHKKDQWKFKQEFNVTGQEAKEIRQRAGVKDYSQVVYILLGGLILFLLFIFWKIGKERGKSD